MATLFACNNDMEDIETQFLTDDIPGETPVEFKVVDVPDDKIIHKGIFSPDFKEYYYTVSDKGFEKFDVYVVKKMDNAWSAPQKAFFNSDYNDHGMSFSPDGNTLYFSSSRPTNVEGIPDTWHIWKSEKVNGVWSQPKFVNIPNLRNKLVSHPTLTNSGTMYFHASNLDYSEMDIYHTRLVNGSFENAERTQILAATPHGKCTPYISPEEDYLIFASIGEQLDLMICYRDGNGHWHNAKTLNTSINTFGQGNPYITPDNKFLFFTSGNHSNGKWKVKWVNIESELTVGQ